MPLGGIEVSCETAWRSRRSSLVRNCPRMTVDGGRPNDAFSIVLRQLCVQRFDQQTDLGLTGDEGTKTWSGNRTRIFLMIGLQVSVGDEAFEGPKVVLAAHETLKKPLDRFALSRQSRFKGGDLGIVGHINSDSA